MTQKTRAMESFKLNETLNTSSATTWIDNGTQNGTQAPTYFQEPFAVKVFQITLWSTIAFLGVIGNLLVCLMVLRRLRKTSMNFYLLSLAIADIGVLAIIYPVSVAKYVSPTRWLLGKAACLYMIPTEEIFFGSSIWSITAIAIERYRNIVGANRYQFWKRSRLRTMLAIMAVWTASFLVSSVPLYPLMVYDSTSRICFVNWPISSGRPVMLYTYYVALIVVWYVLPLAVIAFTYLRIKERVCTSDEFRDSMALDDNYDLTKKPPPTNRAPAKRIWKKSNKTKRILTPLVILFAVTMFPLNALRLWLLIDPSFAGSQYFHLVLGQIGLFVIINSSANPLVYYITSKEFKEAFKAILNSLRERKNIFEEFRHSRAWSWRSSRFTSTDENGEKPANVNTGNNNRISQIGLTTAAAQFESAM